MAANEGTIVQVIGPVVDIDFADGILPEIFNAVKIEFNDAEKSDLTLEVQQHLGENRVRTVAMDITDGLVRGMKAIDTGEPISVPVGPETLGRLINVLGEGIDELGEIKTKQRAPIHHHAPKFENFQLRKKCLKLELKLLIY